ncbi:Flavin-dependent L-tryptophan oxidase RebO [Methylobacterium bullatum]|uniref:Flavin-dependent L-tryptophan oxidase RebO n=1 Tax=Methylobacterium bullatum TaxID=570505 RepID=A0A679J382_9HYPH|nr:Flavin-dependent L-tryptophan oxidase RebO [Methylobacterium bullatum]
MPPHDRAGLDSGRPNAPTKRDILRGAVGTAFTAALPIIAAPALAQTGNAPKHVLVLGAGMSGLTAALALLRRGHRVTVIEYQDRIGGRLLSLPLKNGQFTEAGGGHFRSNMPYVLSYIRRFNLPLLSLNDGLPRYMVGGQTGTGADLANWPWAVSREERNVSVATSLNRYLYRAGLDTDSVLDSRWPDPDSLARYDNVTVGDLVKGVGASDAFCQLLDAHGGTFTSRSQALGAIPDLAYHFGDQNVFRIEGGNNRLPMALAGAIGPANIVLKAEVVSIEQTNSGVRVGTRDGRDFTGDAIVSTIPFSVLGGIDVKPGWSEGKRRMFAEMEWDKTVKVIVQTKTPSWLSKNVHGWPMAGGDRPWERVIDITGNETGSHGNVFFYLNGANAEAILARPRETRAQVTVDQFRADMPDLFDEVITVKDFAWTEQPWIKGSFGSPPLGGGWMIREWTMPEGRIHFAGDFTSLKTGWVEGAIEAGLRAARQIDPRVEAEGRPVIRQSL